MEYLISFGFFMLLTLVLINKWRKKTMLNYQRTVFITGCDSGIGYALATHLDSLGCIVYAGCLLPHDKGAMQLKRENSNNLKIVPLDITNEKSVSDAVNSIKEDLNGKDLWAIINNAGVCVYGEFDWQSPQQCRLQLDVNCYGTINVTKAFLPLIRQSKGRIINITSINGQCVYPGISVYSATKFALEGFSDVLRLELAKFGVRVVVIQPGDFARITQIMKERERHKNEMWDYMSQEKRNTYNGYFQKFHDTVAKKVGLTSAKTFESTSLLADVKDALFSTEPYPRYMVTTLPFKIFFFFYHILPTRWTDSVMLYITKKVFNYEFGQSDD